MKCITLSELEEQQAFVKEAAAYFAKAPHKTSYTKGEIVAGCFLALRWGLDDDCVLLLKLDENLEPTVYSQAIQETVQ